MGFGDLLLPGDANKIKINFCMMLYVTFFIIIIYYFSHAY